MAALFAEQALLPGGWQRDVRVEIDAGGSIADVQAGASPDGAERAGGPLLPGMPDLHSHAFQRAMAGLAERGASGGDDFWSWREAMYALVARVTPELMHVIAAQLYVELLRGGFTSVGEFHYLHRASGGANYRDPAETSGQVVEAARQAGIAITHLPVLYQRGGFDGAPLRGAQQRFTGDVDFVLRIAGVLRQRFAGDADVRIGLAPHSLRAVAEERLRDAVAALHEADAGAPVHVHVAEQPREVEQCVAATGQRPVERLLDQAPVDGRWCLVHATHMTADETARAAASGATAGLCPSTEANLGDGLFALAPFLAHGGRFGIGTDSHVCRDAAEELRWLEYGQRLALGRRCVAARPQRPSVGGVLWDGAARGGAAALGRHAGALEPGARADLVVLDGARADFAALDGDALLDAALFAGGPLPVRHVMVGGRWRVRDGSHPRQDEIAAAYRAALHALRA